MKKHFSKIFILSLLTSTTVLTSCHSDNESNVLDSSEEFNKQNNAFLKEYPKKITGTWKINKMIILDQHKSNVDTILYNIGEISIEIIDQTHPEEPRINMIFNGDVYINNKIIPVRSSRLLPFAYDHYSVSLIEVDPKYFPEPVTSDQLPAEYHFLDSHFFGDNYEMKLSEDGKTWIWKGLNRSAKEIILTKID